MKHTPLPWAVARPEDVKNEHWYAGRTIYSVKGYGKIADTSPFTLSDRANARFIVEACNNHYDLLAQRDRLVEALREAMEWNWLDEDVPPPESVRDMCASVIAEVEDKVCG